MLPEVRKLLTDVHEAGTAILTFVENKTVADLSRDDLLRSAVYFKFAIIGEALAQLRAEASAMFDQITEAHRIIGFRNQIIHGYTDIQDPITWRIIKQKLPILMTEVDQLLSK